MASPRSATTAIAPKLSRPREELDRVEPEVLAELQMGHGIGAGPLVQPALRDADQRRRLFNREPPRGLIAHDAGGGGSFDWRRRRIRARTTSVIVSAT